MSDSVQIYLQQFEPIESLSREVLLREMDAAWDRLGLDNRTPLQAQGDRVGLFYGHPVWVLNGLFSAADPESLAHRTAIASFVAALKPARVADYGGGSGVLARLVAEAAASAAVDIVEPFPSAYFRSRMGEVPQVRFVAAFEQRYDVVIAQDVLEHVDDPVGLALNLVDAVRDGGTLIFANSFWPEIKCHLPTTFFLRHQFGAVMRAAGLSSRGRIASVNHSEVYLKSGPANRPAALRVARRARLLGPSVNAARLMLSKLKRALVSPPP